MSDPPIVSDSSDRDVVLAEADPGSADLEESEANEQPRELRPWKQPARHYFAISGWQDAKGHLSELNFSYHDLWHREPFCGYFVKLGEPINLKCGSVLLHFGEVTADVTIKVELKDDRTPESPQYMAFRRFHLCAGQPAVVRLSYKEFLDSAKLVHGWHRVELWPAWEKIRYVIVVVEARYNTNACGSFRLDRMEYVCGDGPPQGVPMHRDRVGAFDYRPRRLMNVPEPTDPPERPREGQPERGAEQRPGRRPEAIVLPRRDDPSDVLFLSGAGFKPFDPYLPWLGFNAAVFSQEFPKRIDDLLVTAIDKNLLTAADKRLALNEPVFVRGWAASAIYDRPGEAYIYWPRLRFTYIDQETLHQLETRFPTVRDIRDQVHEFALLFNTPYLDPGDRYRLTVEPIYQWIRRSTEGLDLGPREDVSRGVLNVVLSNDPAQRQYFFQAIYGQGHHLDIELDPIERAIRGEWRQWYGDARTAYTSVGTGYSEIIFTVLSDQLPDDVFRQFDVFALLITELDRQGRWRLSVAGSYQRSDIDFTSFPPSGGLLKQNAKINFYRLDTRLVFEAVPDVDASLGFDHVFSDSDHSYDSVSLSQRIAAFNFGPWRGEIGARQTWFYNVDAYLGTLFMEVNFAR